MTSPLGARLARVSVADRTATNGPQDQLEVDYARAPSEAWVQRLLLAFSLAALGVGGLLLLGERKLPQLAPWSVIGVVGLAWWLWLSPSVVGLALLVPAAWILFRQRGVSESRPPAYAD